MGNKTEENNNVSQKLKSHTTYLYIEHKTRCPIYIYDNMDADQCSSFCVCGHSRCSDIKVNIIFSGYTIINLKYYMFAVKEKSNQINVPLEK